MKIFVRVVVVMCAIVLISSSAFAGGGPIVIKSLPATISAPGVYALSKSLTMPNHDLTNNGIMITADDVILDFCGFGITGNGVSSGYGIMLGGRKRVEIKNGFITNFAGGIGEILAGGADLKISNMRIFSNNGNAVGLGSNAMVTGCTMASNAGYGLSINNYGNVITGNVIRNNGNVGVYVLGASDILDNTVNSNGGDGIQCMGGSVVRNNSVYSNTGYGIDASSCSLVDGNACKSNNSGGINISWGSCDHTDYLNYAP